jgi:hypothetical protein
MVLTSPLDRGEWSTSRTSCLEPVETAFGTDCIRGWVGPRASLDDVEKKNNFASARIRNDEEASGRGRI